MADAQLKAITIKTKKDTADSDSGDSEPNPWLPTATDRLRYSLPRYDPNKKVKIIQLLHPRISGSAPPSFPPRPVVDWALLQPPNKTTDNIPRGWDREIRLAGVLGVA